MRGWGPYAREASVWEACCRHSGAMNMFLNCLKPNPTELKNMRIRVAIAGGGEVG